MARRPRSIRRASRKACADRSTTSPAGQAQREFYVNESLSRIDMLMHPSVEGEIAAPPVAPDEGDCYVIGAGATDEWSGRDGQLAGWIGGTWTFATPWDGLAVRDNSTAGPLLYSGGWLRPEAPADPVGGTVVDDQARASIVSLIAVLRQHGLFV